MDKDNLEQFVDKWGMSGVLEMLSDIAYEKSEHVASNWQDRQLAARWERAGRRIGTLSAQMKSIV